MERLLIVDGSNLLFQMFYGMPARIVGKRGQLVHGTLGFVGALLKILKNIRPTHVVVLFDGEHENARCAVDEEYKANRPDFSVFPEEETPFSQLPDIYAALDCLGIKRAETTVCEADDWVASYVKKYGGEHKITVVSFDSDFFQLISENVSVLRYRGEKSLLCDPAYIREKLGISPCQYADYKSLVGDTADNIQGVRGVGPKTAARLLNEYGTLQNILLRAHEIKKPALREALLSSKERLDKNQRLILLNGEGEPPFELASLDYTYRGERSIEVLQKIGAW